MAALEDLLEATKANTAEVQRLIAVTEKLVTLRTEAIDHVKQAAAPAEKPAPKAKAEPKAAAEPKAEAPKEEPKATAPAPVQNDVVIGDLQKAMAPDAGTPASDTMKAFVAAYINWGGSEGAPVSTDEREARKAKIKELLAHPKVKAETVAAIPEGARKAVVKKLVEWIEALAPAEAPATEEVDDL